MDNIPDFIIIGAMKAATTTLYKQLASQPGVFMSELKEPNFFSDDDQFSKGTNWYLDLFRHANEDDLIGEASTHYTKFPTYPKTVSRMLQVLDSPKFIYIIRHPIERLISQYIHEWSQGKISKGINEAIIDNPELINYSLYYTQLSPYIDAYSKSQILLVFFERLKLDPQQELDRICVYLDYQGKMEWCQNLGLSNISSERIRKFPFYDVLIESEIAKHLRRTLIPKSFRKQIKQNFQMKHRPLLDEQTTRHLEELFNKDLQKLGDLLGISLNCENYHNIVTKQPLNLP